MSIGFNLVLPSANVYKIRVQDDAERRKVIDDLCRQWESYCDSHWLSENHEEPYCGENRVKRFLDGLGYFMMLNDTKDTGIVTEYKAKVHAAKEIPVSACPAAVQDVFYASGAGDAPETIPDRLDVTAKKATTRRTARYRTKSDRVRDFEKAFRPLRYEYATVDTDGNFSVGGVRLHVSDKCQQYAAKQLKDDVLYDMDKVIAAYVREGKSSEHVYFFDMNFEAIDKYIEAEGKKEPQCR